MQGVVCVMPALKYTDFFEKVFKKHLTSYYHYDIIKIEITERMIPMQSEHEFLAQYRMEDYERPSVTADVAVFMIRRKVEESYRKEPQIALSLLLIRRGGHPYKDCWALPGGFLKKEETIEECAVREIQEETGVTPSALMLTGIFSAANRDPRGWIISAAFASVLREDAAVKAGDDAAEAMWFDIQLSRAEDGLYHLTLTHDALCLAAVLEEQKCSTGTKFSAIERGALAFDHAEVIASALMLLRRETVNFGAVFDFLPEKFTLTGLQRVQELVTGATVLAANFRRKAAEYVEETEEFTSGAGHRPAKLFRRRMQ